MPARADERPTETESMMRRVYLDYNATAPLLPEALEAAVPYYTSVWGNASSIHRQGREARAAVEDAREQVAQLIGAADPLDLVFTSGGTEAVNLAIQGYAYGNRSRDRHIITTRAEHPAALDTCRALEQRGFDLTYLPVDGLGRVDPEALASSIRPQTILLTLIHGNHEVGTLQPLAALVEVAHGQGVPVHVDAVQAVGRVPLDVAALGKACALMGGRLTDEYKRLSALRDRLEIETCRRIPDVHTLGNSADRLPNTTNISFAGVKGEALVFNLD